VNNKSPIAIKQFTCSDWGRWQGQSALVDGEIHLWHFQSLPPIGQNSLDACQPLFEFYLGSGYRIERNEQGKPIALNAGGKKHTVQFNLSHTQDQFLIGFVRSFDIGVDIEEIKSHRPWNKLAERFFCDVEVQQLKATPPSSQEDFFYSLWTLKESMIKCLGISILTGLTRARFIKWDDNSFTLINPSQEDHDLSFFHNKDRLHCAVTVKPLSLELR
jgi:phosphopantetheine--protein transferase-like protein